MKSKELIFGILLIFGVIVLGVFLISQPWFTADDVLGPVLSDFFNINTEPEPPPQSPHRGSVGIAFVSLGNPEAETETYVEIASAKDPESYTNVTGWALVTDKGVFNVPQARDFNTVEGVTGDIFLRGGSVLRVYADEGQNRRVSNDQWAVWLDADFLQFPHGEVVLYDDQGREVEQYEY